MCCWFLGTLWSLLFVVVLFDYCVVEVGFLLLLSLTTCFLASSLPLDIETIWIASMNSYLNIYIYIYWVELSSIWTNVGVWMNFNWSKSAFDVYTRVCFTQFVKLWKIYVKKTPLVYIGFNEIMKYIYLKDTFNINLIFFKL